VMGRIIKAAPLVRVAAHIKSNLVF
jgi:hypothetical protein